MRKIFFLLYFGVIFNAFSQDCPQAINLTENEYKAAAPSHAGEQELGKNDMKSLYYFEKEHFTTWYKFKMQADCELTFEIIPDNPKDDYDFLLFLCQESDNYCEKIRNKTLKPLRTNISRNNKKINSLTGLKSGNFPKFVHSGIGSAYSQSVMAKKGDFFVLIVDNVYENGSGHTIRVKNCFDKNTNEKTEEKPIIEKVEKIEIVKEEKVQENIRPDTLKTELPKTEEITNSEEQKDLKELENAFEKNEVLVLEKLYFHGNSAFLKPEAAPQISALYDFLQKYPNTKIILHAHTNGSSRETFSTPKNPKKSVFASNEIMAFSPETAKIFKGNVEKLSEERGNIVKTFLVNKGIDEDRIEVKSWGDKKMLYDQYSVDSYKNRRIEVEILK